MLVIRRRARGYELPKGHIEAGETAGEAAARELCEETGLVARLSPGPLLDTIVYHFDGDPPVRKRVAFFLFEAEGSELAFGARPAGTRARRWISESDIADLELCSENLRPLLRRVLQPG